MRWMQVSSAYLDPGTRYRPALQRCDTRGTHSDPSAGENTWKTVGRWRDSERVSWCWTRTIRRSASGSLGCGACASSEQWKWTSEILGAVPNNSAPAVQHAITEDKSRLKYLYPACKAPLRIKFDIIASNTDTMPFLEVESASYLAHRSRKMAETRPEEVLVNFEELRVLEAEFDDAEVELGRARDPSAPFAD